MGTIRDQKTGETIGTIEAMMLSGGTHCVVARYSLGAGVTRVKTFSLPECRHSYAAAEHRAVTWIMAQAEEQEAEEEEDLVDVTIYPVYMHLMGLVPE